MSDTREMTIHMIGHGHIDPTWLWRWTEGYEEVRATFRSALERMRETPEFKFTASSACFYQWFKESEPALFEELKQRVAEGRWEIVGGWWIEPDCNVPCGESFVRQGLYGLRFFQTEFGVRVKVGFNPDSFGHAAAFPQILKKLGQDFYVFMRPMADVEKDYPGGDTFWWEAADGSRVLTANIHESYNTIPAEVSGHERELEDRFARALHYPCHNPAQSQLLFFFGVGNHGGGPTKRSISWIQRMQEAIEGPEVEFSSVREYFVEFEASMPPGSVSTIREELQHHARGCYSLHHAVKSLNRKSEHALMAAERLSAVAWLQGFLPYPQAALESAWKDLLYNQFHDILAGTSLPSSYADTRDQAGAARHTALSIVNRAVQCMAREISTDGPTYSVVAVNILPWPVCVPVEISEGIERGPDDPAFVEHKRAHIHDSSGLEVPSQVVTGERVGGRRYVFLAALPALGYRVYGTTSAPMAAVREARARSHRQLEVMATAIENEFWRVEFDPGSGGIARLFDKRNHVDVVREATALSAIVDGSDTWGHGVKEWRAERGRFGAASLSVAEDGEVLGRVRAHSGLGASRVITEYTLYRDSDIIDVQMRVNWQEEYTALKWVFATNLIDAHHVAECGYGHAVRASGSGEEPCQQWVALTGTVETPGGMPRHPYSLGILNDGVFGYDATGPLLRMTLLRSPAFAHHDPCLYEAHKGHEIMDQGWHTFRFRIVASAAPWHAEDLAHKAWELNVPPIVHLESGHGGTRSLEESFVLLDAPHVLCSVIKLSEDGEDLIVRAHETAGEASQGQLRIGAIGKVYQLTFAAHEIKTVRINRSTWVLRECNLLEE